MCFFQQEQDLQLVKLEVIHPPRQKQEKLLYLKYLFADNDEYVRQQLAEAYMEVLQTIPICGEYKVVIEDFSINNWPDCRALEDYIEDECRVVDMRFRIPGSKEGLVEGFYGRQQVRDALLKGSRILKIYGYEDEGE